MHNKRILAAILVSCTVGCILSLPDALGSPTVGKTSDALTEAHKLLKSGKFSDAMAYFDKAIAIDPKCVRAYVGRARAKHLSGGTRRSIDDCNKAIALDPKNAEAYDIRGTDYLIMQDYEKALQDFDSAVRLDPKNANRYVARGNAYSDLKRLDEALKDYNHALELQPDNDVYINRARAYNDLGQYDKALKDSNKAIELAVTQHMPVAALDAINYTNRGRAYLGLGQTDKAVSDLSKAISSNPRTLPGEAFYFRAQAYAKLGKSDMAAKDSEAAKKLGYKPRVVEQALAHPTSNDSDRDKLEREFGKYFGSYKTFEIYGVRKKRGSRDGDRDSDGTQLSTLTGIIVSPAGQDNGGRKFSAEVKTDKGVVVKCTTETYSFSLQRGFEVKTEKSKSTGRQVTTFEWVVPSSTQASTLRITSGDVN